MTKIKTRLRCSVVIVHKQNQTLERDTSHVTASCTQLVPGAHSPTKVPLAHQITLFTGLLALLMDKNPMDYSKAWYNTPVGNFPCYSTGGFTF